MRRTVMAITAAAALGLTGLTAAGASAGPAAIAPGGSGDAVHLVQDYTLAPEYWDDRWERRLQWREWRAQQDQARIAEAARREAMMIEQEREQRRAWRRAQREQHYGGYGYHRGW